LDELSVDVPIAIRSNHSLDCVAGDCLPQAPQLCFNALRIGRVEHKLPHPVCSYDRGMREFVFYTSNPQGVETKLRSLRESINSHTIQGMIRPDGDWDVYRQFV